MSRSTVFSNCGRITSQVLLAVLLASCAFGASIDEKRLNLVSQRMQEYVDHGVISGATYLIAYQGRVVARGAVGFADIENRKPMHSDTIMQVMSQTKSFTGVAAMMLVEEGKLDLTRPVEDYLPEFKGQLVEERRFDGSTFTHLPEHPMTVGQLMSHTSGLAFLPPTGPYSRISFTLDATLEEAVRGFAREHLLTEPGEKFVYSNMGIAVLGRVVEVVSGQAYATFVKIRILDPLGMDDSFFFPPESKKERIAMVYQRQDGKLVLSGSRAQGGDPAAYRKGAKYPGPEMGLYSTVNDLFRFYQMLANGGEFEGHRYLSQKSVSAMTQDVSPDCSHYGLTFSVLSGSEASFHLASAGTYGHGGAFGTAGFVDPKAGLVVLFLPQISDGTSLPAWSSLLQVAESAVE